MNGKKTNIQQIITKNLAALVILVLGLMTLFFSYVQYTSYKKSVVESLQYSCQSIGENIDLQASQLDTIVLNTLNSSDVKSTLHEFSTIKEHSKNYAAIKQRLAGLLLTMKGFDYSVRQINAYSLHGTGYGVGDYSGTLKRPTTEDWAQRALDRKGRLYMPIPTDEKGYISFYRVFFDEYHAMHGIMEGRKLYRDFFKSALNPGVQYNADVIIYNSDHDIVFPVGCTSTFPYYKYQSDKVVSLHNTETGRHEYVAYYDLDKVDLTVVMAVKYGDIISPLLASMAGALIVFIIIFFIGLLMIRVMTRQITNPISRIYHFLSDSDTDEMLDMEPTNIVEIDKLINSINNYKKTSAAQTQTILTLHEQELQAQMLALQSQMNPHFLYNSLASISEMAKEGLTDNVSKMTVNISQILRYISSNRKQESTVEEELELCNMYLECMALRFGKDLEYSFDVADELLDLMIPKLCIQLLVENAIKAVTTQSPIWKIRIHGYLEDEHWWIEVIDNGPGFLPEVDKKLRSQMDQILATRTIPSLKIEGMGILNVFLRLYLLDGISFLFDFGNNEEGGAFVKVGRHLDVK